MKYGLENKRKVRKKLLLTTYATVLWLIYSMCARSMKMSFPDPSENHQPYTKNSVKIIWIYIFVHFRQPCNAHRAERKEEGSVLSVFKGSMSLLELQFTNYNSHKDTVPPKECRDEISLNNVSPTVPLASGIFLSLRQCVLG